LTPGEISSLNESFACFGHVFRGVQVAEGLGGESGGVQVLFGDELSAGFVEEGVDFIAGGAEGLLGGIGERAAVEGAEGLQAIACARNSDACRGIFGSRDQVLQQRGRDERDVDGEDEVEVVIGGTEGGVDAGERAASGEKVFDDGGGRGVFLLVADDVDVGSYGAGEIEGAGEQGASVERDEGFVGAHAGALASGEDEGGERGGGPGHVGIIQRGAT